MFKEFAEFVALHYALSHRNDSEYWKNCLNKSWEKSLIDLEPVGVSGMNKAVWQRTYDFKFGSIGGLHCIAAGMHWSPTDKNTLIKEGEYTEPSLEKEFEGCIHNLNERKELCEQLVKEKPSLFSVLKNVH
jgi:hypothetical protein